MSLKNIETILDIDKMIAKQRGKSKTDDLVDELKGVLSNVWEDSTRQALIETINTLQKFSGPVTAEEIGIIDEMVSDIMGMDLDAATKKTLIDIQEAAYLLGGKAGAGATIAWNIPDQKALAVLDSNLRFWIGSYYDDNLQEGFKAVLQEYLDGGFDRHEMAILMRDHFRTLGEKGDSYWDLLADNTVTKTREIGRVAGYEQAQIELVRIKARLDDRTTEICKRLHGHVIAVSDLRSQVDKYLKACDTKNKEKIKASWPWWSDSDAAKKMRGPKSIQRLVRRNKVGLSPYHGRCRTITVPEFSANPGDHKSDFFDK